MPAKQSLVSDGMWLAGTQGLAAIGQLAGIRMLTEILPPSLFGEFSLWIGFVALLATGIANPTMQAVLRYYPEYELNNSLGCLKTAAWLQLRRIFVWLSIPILLAMIAAVSFGYGGAMLLMALASLLWLDINRTQNLAFLNAARIHRVYGMWIVLDAWARPILAWIMYTWVGGSATQIIIGYVLASLLSWLIVYQKLPKIGYRKDESSLVSISSRIWKYSLPLLPLGLLGWLTGMGDRYIIGVFMTSSEVGLYVAVFGLASRPMLMVGNVIETTIRPAYHQAFVEKDFNLAKHYLKVWILFVLVSTAGIVLVSWLGHGKIAAIFLGERYRQASFLLPLIFTGYGFLVLSHIANRVVYANEDTRSILVIEIVAATTAIVFGVFLISRFGLLGAGLSVSIVYGFRLVVSYWFAHRWLIRTETDI